ncbi:cell division protein SepF [Amphibacillus xylanus]|uniref:Cell division protein SepF n=1 Tax=Amphibacillus xylanus (strain ATCC 51415 / DSM 6626 / JCM 7361 / LMG 17667 / NBRC 15112 / Ep01) TaxID=698758 RepID=K0IZ18_AMPXN|nr:cell division protein SepF [Amphibacillus xylanus]BAM47704.1 cell division protein SepF [Amphibacillus xylanus NBRC 15112]
MSIKNKFRTLFSVEDEEYYEEYQPYRPSEPEEQLTRSEKYEKKDRKNVVSLQSVQPQIKVVLSEPRSYDETQEIADHIVNRRSVVINLQRVDYEQAKRIVDFLSGTVYAVSGDIQKLGPHTFLCTPDNVEITGNITQMIEDDEWN